MDVKHYLRRPLAGVGDDGNEGRVRTESNRMENSGESVSFSISPSALLYLITNHNIVRDKLLLHLGAKFRRKFIISHVKLQNCYGDYSYVSVPR